MLFGKILSPALGKMVPTWTAYNSLMGQKKPLTNVAMFPIINGNPTEWENLYASIKEAEKLRRKIFKGGKTIISFVMLCAIWYNLCNLKNVKNTLKPANLLKLTLLYGCFSRFLNCTNGTKSRNAPHLTCSYTLKQSDYKKEMTSKIRLFSGWVNYTLCSVF